MRLSGEILPPPPDDPALALKQFLREDGTALDESAIPKIANAELGRMLRGMLTIRIMDERLLGMQRQGRIGFYGEARGQEAAVIGAAAALGPKDWLVPALREAGAAIYRGLSLRTYISQIFGNENDVAKGRQLPCHPGTRAARYVTMSSCIATQLPHATGMAMAAKILKEDSVILGCLGDGASSEEDFHVGLNFAAVFRAPVVFFCQNNQWAISTPTTRQTASPTYAIKAYAYGMRAARVDGNDVLAVYSAVKEAVDQARSGGGPTFIEALTYRVSAHSSSDDPTRYRDESITEKWRQKDPIERFQKYLIARKVITAATIETMKSEIETEVREAIAAEESVGAPPLRSIIEDVFAEVPQFLADELAEIESLPRQKLGGVHQ